MMMRFWLQSMPYILVAYGCTAFHFPVNMHPATKFQMSSWHRQHRLLSMSVDTQDLVEALSHATSALGDASWDGPAAEQIPYVPGNIPDFPKIVAGSAACVLAYAWAAYEFGKRIVTQRACEICQGTGLINTTRSGVKLTNPRKCYACGGFLPWENWGRFWRANMDVGNGGVLQRPARDYDELNKVAKAAKEQGMDE